MIAAVLMLSTILVIALAMKFQLMQESKEIQAFNKYMKELNLHTFSTQY